MAVVSPAPAITQQMTPINFPEYIVPGSMAAAREIVEEPVARVLEEKIYVAVGKSFKENKSLLTWALQNSGGRKICIIHVHEPAQMIPLMGTKFHASSLKDQEVRAFREIERQDMHKTLDEYLLFCRRMGVQAEKLYIEMESIEKGILQLISGHGIRQLAMGQRQTSDFQELRRNNPLHMYCKYREGALDANGTELRPSLQQASPNTEIGQSNHLRSQSITLGQKSYPRLTNPAQDLFRRARSVTFGHQGGKSLTPASLDNIGGPSTSQNRSDAEGASSVSSASSDDCDALSRSTSQGSLLSTYPSSGMVNVGLVPLDRTEGSENGSELSTPAQLKEDPHHSTPSSVLQDGNIDDPLYDQLEQAMSEAENSRREAFEETVRRAKAERDAREAIRRAKASEGLYAEESRQRKEIEEALAKEKEELEKSKKERDEVMEELHIALDQKKSLERQIAEMIRW
ncbi:hypothetical protein GH714_038764 [Hevea brasiliensis]|uniref:RING-type E3 ubiquitin transferase n=1 Tax=Hevea brasiliensis TaxID=3981 RepID=A0A6A6MNE6_HEVBR|nr:hypothetical protein GH714_038764 [Hevea brasiliensis]